MARTIKKSGLCPICQRPRLVERQGCSHVLHGSLTAVTAGMWGFVWGTIAAMRAGQPFRCTSCGTPVTPIDNPSRERFPALEVEKL